MKRRAGMAGSREATQWYEDILFPHEPSRDFILNGSTYEMIHRLAAQICRLNSSSGENSALLCLCSDDKALLAAAFIAALAGGPRLVLPYAFSRQVMEEVLETLPVSFILADRPGDFPPGPEVMIPPLLPRAGLQPYRVIDPDEPFLTLYTGGSTGKPKAWSKTPRNILTEARYLTTTFTISSDDIFLATVPPRHIYGLLYSIVVPFLAGARVLPGEYTFPREILRAAGTHGASVLVSVPVHYRVLKVHDLQRYKVRIAFSSAGALDKEDAAYFYEKTGLDITEIYGSTETGGVATRNRFRDGESWNLMAPVDWTVRDERLHVRSPFVSPTLPIDGEGFFATADRALAEEDRRFVLKGRADDIVKIGGKRVDLSEVLAKLKRIPGVRDAAVIAFPNGTGRENELAALVATHLDAQQVRRQLALVSETYTVPKRVAIADEIPVLATGKYDQQEIERIIRGTGR